MSLHGPTRLDLQLVAGLISPGAKVLDVGCGDGELLAFLQRDKQIDGRGVELSQHGVNLCVERGLSVIQGDADHDLVYYPDRGFDVVIMSQTLQATRNPKAVLDQLRKLGLKRFIREREEVNKEAILNEPEAVAHVAGITISQGEDFIVTPFETELTEVA